MSLLWKAMWKESNVQILLVGSDSLWFVVGQGLETKISFEVTNNHEKEETIELPKFTYP